METIKRSLETLEELVFQNRNKTYGAYLLRRQYKKRAITAFLLAFLLVGGGVVVPHVNAFITKNDASFVDTVVVKAYLEDLNNKHKDILDQQKIAEPPTEEIKSIVKVPRIVVVDTIRDPENGFDILGSNTTINDPVPDSNIQVAATTKKDEIDDIDKKPGTFDFDESATFNGGDMSVFRAWVADNISFPQIAIEYGITGKVVVEFSVSTKGDVVDVKIANSTDPSDILNNAVVEVIKSSPKWSPGIKGGNPIKQKFIFSISFKSKNGTT